MQSKVLLLFLLIWFPNLPRFLARRCVDCEGSEDCVSGQCQGDYCMTSILRPKLMSRNFGKAREIKGCVSGTLLRKNISSHCESYMEDQTLVSTCFCNEKDYCNRNIRNTKKDPIRLVFCDCDGKAEGCGDSGACLGEYCTLLRDSVSGDVLSRGCINSSLPLVERRGAGACMQPPITAPIHHMRDKGDATNLDELSRMESCMCSENRCNRVPPTSASQNERIMDCSVELVLNYNGFVSQPREKTTCKGEYCYYMDLSNSHEESTVLEYNVRGCMTFDTSAQLAEELNPEGCVTFGSKKFQLKACYETSKDTASLKTKPKTSPPIQHTTPKTEVTETPVEKPNPGPNRSWKPSSKTRVIPSEPPLPAANEEAETNTAIVGVFVAIMILIVIAGVVWKFEIHKKLFRAKYESVAG